MTVYLDLVMGLNFVVDLLLLTGTNRLAGYPAGLGRAALGAVLGGIYGGACLLPGLGFLGNVLWRAVSLGLMSMLAFGTGPGVFRRGILFCLLSMALGGIVLGLGSGGIWSLAAGLLAVSAMCALGFGRGNGQKQYVEVLLNHSGRSVRLTALYDTGNTLRDPLTGERILVAGAGSAYELLKLERDALMHPVETISSGICPGARLIPYRAVGQDRGFLLGYRFREAMVNGRKGSILVAFTAQGLGEGREEFNALIGGVA